MRGLTRRMTPDRIQNQIRIGQHGLVPETQDSKAASRQISVARHIFGLAQPVHAAVQFDQIVPSVCGDDGSFELQVAADWEWVRREMRNAAGGCES